MSQAALMTLQALWKDLAIVQIAELISSPVPLGYFPFELYHENLRSVRPVEFYAGKATTPEGQDIYFCRNGLSRLKLGDGMVLNEGQPELQMLEEGQAICGKVQTHEDGALLIEWNTAPYEFVLLRGLVLSWGSYKGRVDLSKLGEGSLCWIIAQLVFNDNVEALAQTILPPSGRHIRADQPVQGYDVGGVSNLVHYLSAILEPQWWNTFKTILKSAGHSPHIDSTEENPCFVCGAGDKNVAI